MNNYITLSIVTLRNRLKEEVRYPIQFIFNSLMFVGVAYVFAFGSVAIQEEGDVMSGMAGFLLAFLAGAAISQPLEYMGTSKLDDFYLRPISSVLSIFWASLGRGLELILTLSMYILFISILKNEPLDHFFRMLIIGMPVFLSMLGIGFLVAGIRLIFIKVGALPQLLWIALIGTALGANTEALHSLSQWLNFGGGLLYLKTGEIDVLHFIIIFTLSIFLGVITFKKSEQHMFKNGLIGQE